MIAKMQYGEKGGRMEINKDKLYTANEVAEILRVSVATIYRQIDYMEIKTVKVGKQYRILGREIIKYIQRNGANV